MDFKIIPIQSSPIVRLARTVARRKSDKIARASKNSETQLSPKVFTEDEIYIELTEENSDDSESYSLFGGSNSNSKFLKLYAKILKLKYPYLRTLDIYT